ncbi:MAG: LysR family transcriptional regulator [Henriciella sp.]|nr:LysR family transcriptional regulator [Henriciella sp.]
MELRQLKYFVTVAEEKNFSHAAQRLNVSQPPITRQIRKLEEELGVTLFTRTPKGADLTPAGQVFLEDARQTLAQLARGAERCRAAQRGELGTLDVGYFGSPIYRVVPSVLQAFREQHPTIKISLNRISKAAQIDALKLGQIHIGFGRFYSAEPGLVIEQILSEGLSIAVPEDFSIVPYLGNELSIFDSVPLIVFPSEGRPNFADQVLSILKREGLEPKIGAVAEDVRSALTQTTIGSGATIVPGTVADFSWTGVKFIPLESLRTECPVNCIYRRSDTSPILRAVLKTLREYRRNMSPEA